MRIGRLLLLSLVFVGYVLADHAAAAGSVTDLLHEADRLAWLTNWHAALPIYTRAEAESRTTRDARSALYAKFGRLRGQMQTRSLGDLSTELARDLATPLAHQDGRLRLRGLTVKGDIDLEWDIVAAQQDWQQVRALARELGDAGWENRATGELGMIAFLKGDTGTATRMVQQALDVATRSGDIGGQLRYMSAIGNGIFLAGYAPLALGFADRALSFAAEHPEMGFPYVAHSTKVLALLAANRLDDAERVARTALGAAKADDRRIKEIELELMLARIAEARGRADLSMASLERAASLARTGDVRRLLADAEEGLADTYRTRGDLPRARQHADAAVAATRAAGSRFTLPIRLGVQADIAAAEGRPAMADRLYQHATDIVEGVMINVPSRTAQARLVGVMSDLYTKHFALAVDRLRDPEKAFRIIERARGRALADVLRTYAVDRPTPTPADLARQETVSRLQLRLLSATVAHQRRALLAALWEAEQRASAPVDQERLARAQNTTADIRTVQRQLEPSEVLLEYVLAEPQSFCLVITRRSLRVAHLPGKTRMEQLVDEVVKTVRSREPTTSAGLRELRRVLLDPLPELASATRLSVALDGALHRLPFDILMLERPASNPVVQVMPSAGVLALLRSRSDDDRTGIRLLAVGGVPYETMFKGTPERAKLAENGTATGLFDVMSPPAPPALPMSLAEVRAVADTFGEESVVLTADRARESALESLDLGRFHALHFAVHGVADVKAPERAALVLLGDPGSTHDGLLQPREIARWRLRARLVVLSACDTAVGPALGQEGVLNLARAFLVAGARSVLTTLWPVNDITSTALMRRFYAHLASGLAIGDALTQAKDELLEANGRDAMATVAAFQLVGDGAGPLTARPSAGTRATTGAGAH